MMRENNESEKQGRKRGSPTFLPLSFRKGIGKKKELRLYKYLGAQFPLYIFEYVSLYVYAKGTTKSVCIQELVKNWVHEKRKEENDAILVKQIAERAQKEWDENYKGFEKLSFDRFKEAVEYELRNACIKSVYIKLILSELKP